jgi:hypothetical protein
MSSSLTELDPRGVPLTTDRPAAGRALEEALMSLVAHRADLPQRLETALALDGELVLGHVVRGFGYRLLARRSFLGEAESALGRARASVEARGATDREKLFVEALASSIRGDSEGVAEHLEAAVTLTPRDLLAIKLSHAVHFMLGRSSAMRANLERVQHAWRDDALPGAGAVRGCLAFALVEVGEVDRGEALGRSACALEPNAWSVHAVSHVHATKQELSAGTAWLADHERLISSASNLGAHLRWHAALFDIARGEPELGLATYDRYLASRLAPDYRDFVNASSLLLRLEAADVDVGDRWEPLARVAQGDGVDPCLGFAELHSVLALVRAGWVAEAKERIAAMAEAARTAPGIDGEVEREVAIPLAEAMLAPALRGAALIRALLPSVQRLGGSRVQRELFTILATDLESEGSASRRRSEVPRVAS